VDGAGEGPDGGLVDVEDGEAGEEGGGDGEAGEEGGGDGAAVGGGREQGYDAGEDALGDEADFGVVVEGEVEEEGEDTVAEGGGGGIVEA